MSQTRAGFNRKFHPEGPTTSCILTISQHVVFKWSCDPLVLMLISLLDYGSASGLELTYQQGIMGIFLSVHLQEVLLIIY